jgi:hypothetical protein
MVTVQDIWSGDWHAKIRGRVHAQGCETISDFAKRHPSLPYFKLARLLGNDVAAVQLAIVHFEEAKASGCLREVAMAAFCRALHQHLKRGWNKGMRVDFHTAGAYAEWRAMLESRAFAPELIPLGEAVWKALKDSVPPTGWLPSGPDDPIVTAAFAKAWPAERAKVKRQQYGFLCPNCTGTLSSPPPDVSEMTCPHCGDQIDIV